MDLKMEINNNSFHSRASAIIYNKDKTKVLLFKIEDGRDFYLLPGGKIKFNEDSKNAIKREILEETGYDLEYGLCSLEENFLKRKSQNIMQYNFCYKAIYNGKIDKVDFNCLDHEGQTFHWIDIDKLDKIKILPQKTISYIKSNNLNIIHYIDWSKENE